MIIRKAEIKDLEQIMGIYELARSFMKKQGNASQWGQTYPPEKLIRKDIEQGNFYVCVKQERITGVFAFILGEDPTYQEIRQGAWHSDLPYGAVHRVASDGSARGLIKACFDFCTKIIDYIRIDTHENNKPMQGALQKYGFRECGIIHTDDGTPRIAFDYLKN